MKARYLFSTVYWLFIPFICTSCMFYAEGHEQRVLRRENALQSPPNTYDENEDKFFSSKEASEVATKEVPRSREIQANEYYAGIGSQDSPTQDGYNARYQLRTQGMSQVPVYPRSMNSLEREVVVPIVEPSVEREFREPAPVDYPRRPPQLNASLWPANSEVASYYRDFRAFQPYDVITIVIDESAEGNKTADTDSETKFSLLAGITEFFGLETSKWAKNTSLDPTQLIRASTDSSFESQGQTARTGTLRAKISAVIVEVLPNGLLKLEGKKTVSVNNEDEVIVISGLVRQPDINAYNQVQSSRIANLQIDFYGIGRMADDQTPSWGYRVFKAIWPF